MIFTDKFKDSHKNRTVMENTESKLDILLCLYYTECMESLFSICTVDTLWCRIEKIKEELL